MKKEIFLVLLFTLFATPLLAQSKKKVYLYCIPRNYSLLTKIKLNINGQLVQLGSGAYKELTINEDSLSIDIQNKEFQLVWKENKRVNGEKINIKAAEENYFVATLELNRKVVFLSPVKETVLVENVSKEYFNRAVPARKREKKNKCTSHLFPFLP
jgi:hypothetical protein